MGKALAKQIKGMSWTARISLVLVCTLLTSVFMYEGWYKPRDTQAAVAALNSWTNLSQTAPASASGTVQAGNITATAGTNRILLVAVAVETNAATTATSPMTMSVTVGGTTLTLLKNTFATASRSHAYIGYLLNAQIPTAASAVSVTYNTGATATTVTGIDVKWATYSGVNQTTPFTSSNAVVSAATSVTFGAAISYVIGGQTFFIAENGGTPATITNPTGFTSTAATNTATSGQSTFVSQDTVATAAGSYASTTSVAFGGTTSTRSALVVASLNPAATTAPTITSLNPTSITRPATGSTTTTMAITGTGFAAGATVSVTPTTGITVGTVNVLGSTSISVPITVASTAATGAYSVTVTSGGLTSNASTFNVTAAAAPTISTVSPASVTQGVATTVTITGTNLTGGTPNFSNASATVTSTSATTIVATVTGTTANTGTVSVTTAGGTSGTLPFTVTAAVAAPTISTVSPASVTQGVATTVTITGTNLTGGTPNFSNASATVTSTSATTIVASVTGTTANTGTVSVTTAGGTSGTLPFTVSAAATCTTGAQTLTINPTTATIAAGSTATYTVTVSNGDTGGACTNRAYTLTRGTPSNTANFVTSALSATALSVPPSGTATATFTVTANAGVANGTTNSVAVSTTGTTPTSVTTTTTVGTPTLVSPLLHNSANLSTTYGTWGTTYTCATCHNQTTSNIKRVATSITTPTGARSVVFNRLTSSVTNQMGVFGNDQRTTLTSSTNVCEVCHHQTKYHQYSSSKATVTTTHNNRADCTTCHSHAKGFAAAGCDTCHPAGGGLVTSTPVTNATGGVAGAHAKHTSAPYNMACATCHNGYTTNPMGNSQIEMSFQVNQANFAQFNPSATVAFGTISGKSPLTSYTWVGKTGTTVAASTNTNTSCNVYCHGNWANSRSTADPNWTGGAMACNSCHFDKTSAPAGAGDHQIHLALTGSLNLSCSNCHSSGSYTTGHMNGTVSWAFNATPWFNANSKYKGLNSGNTNALAPSATYGSCATTSCHGQSSPAAWGTPLVTTVQCFKCHGQRSATATFISVSSANVAPGVNPLNTAQIGYDTANPPNSANTSPRVGMHQEHLTAASGLIGRSVLCSECHVKVSTIADATHLDYTTATVAFSGRGVALSHTNANVTRTAGVIVCNNTYCHTGHLNSGTNMAPKWNETTYLSSNTLNSMTIADCNKCHGLPPRSKFGHQSTAAISAISQIATLCSGCHNSLSTTAATTNSGIFTNQALHMNGDPNAVGGDCIGCHGSAIASPKAAALDATVTQRRSIVTEFGQVSNHLRTRAGGGASVSAKDCVVCHMEGNADGTTNSSYHQNGYVELRDPATNAPIKAVNFSGTPGSFTNSTTNAVFVRFSRNLAVQPEAETTVIPGTKVSNFRVLAAIQVNHCLKCHSSTGSTVFVTGGSALKPFANTSTAVNVNSQFATTNRSYHPVLGKQNNSYVQGTRMNAPWNITKTNGNTTSYGYLMTCWDCHATPAATGTITSTVTAHGSAITAATGSNNSVEIRGVNWRTGTLSATNNNTFCVKCHATYDTNTTTNHGTGSAYSAGGSSSMSLYLRYGCTYCHSTSPNPASNKRRGRSADVHGYDNLATGAAFVAGHGYAFIRSSVLSVNHIVKQVGATAYTPTCGTGNISISNGTTNCSNGMGTYTVGGVY